MINKTAVQFLYEQLKDMNIIQYDDFYINDMFEKALELEKQQILDAHMTGEGYNDQSAAKIAEKYYNETYIKQQ